MHWKFERTEYLVRAGRSLAVSVRRRGLPILSNRLARLRLRGGVKNANGQ